MKILTMTLIGALSVATIASADHRHGNRDRHHNHYGVHCHGTYCGKHNHDGGFTNHHHKPEVVRPKPKPLELTPEQAFLVFLFGLSILDNGEK